MMKGTRGGEMGILGRRRYDGGYFPLDGPSAGFSALGDVSCANRSAVIGLSETGVKASKDGVGFRVAVTTCPPTFNDTGVVPMCNDSGKSWVQDIDGADEHFESDRFCPSDVSVCASSILPTQKESMLSICHR
jgi:hypothetical protein